MEKDIIILRMEINIMGSIKMVKEKGLEFISTPMAVFMKECGWKTKSKEMESFLFQMELLIQANLYNQ